MDERERLIEIMNSQGLTAKQLSQELGISAGTLSNILGGRNKPSLDLLQNIAAHYPHIQADWLFLGKGEMYRPDYIPVMTKSPMEPDLFSQPQILRNEIENSTETASEAIQLSSSEHQHQRKIDKIFILYTDGTFEER